MSIPSSPYQAPSTLGESFISTSNTGIPVPNLSLLDYDSSAECDLPPLAQPSSSAQRTGTIPTSSPVVPSLTLASTVGTFPRRVNPARSRSLTFPFTTFTPSYNNRSGDDPGSSHYYYQDHEQGQLSTPFSKPVDPTVGLQNPDGSIHVATVDYQRLAANLQAKVYEEIMAATWDDGGDNGGEWGQASRGEDRGECAEPAAFSARDRALASLESLGQANSLTAGGNENYKETVTGSLCDLADAVSGVDGFTEKMSLLSLTQGLEGCMLPNETARDTT